MRPPEPPVRRGAPRPEPERGRDGGQQHPGSEAHAHPNPGAVGDIPLPRVVAVRVVVIGAGGIGGSIGARLHQSGYDVALVARGAHGAAIQERGLTFATPEERVTLRIPTYARPDELTWTSDDVVVLATKSQDTEAAALDLFGAAGPDVPVVSAQNGVANEQALSRWFAHVHGMCVMMPTAHLEPGVVMAHSAAATGILDLGRFPAGTDDVDEAVAEALRASRIESVPRPDIMRWKYRKLLNNLGNAVQALCGTQLDTDAARDILDLLVAEAEQAFAAAGIDAVTEAEDDVRRADHLQLRPVAGEPRGGGSTWQSLQRGKAVETDFLNGEIALLGRVYGVPTPANAEVQRLMREAVTHGAGPGSMTAAELLSGLER
jgi:2-dehydropantoate 2-reductase